MTTERQTMHRNPALSALAAEAGLQEHWIDARRRPQRVSPDTLRALLHAMGLPCDSPADLRASRAEMKSRRAGARASLIVGHVGEPLLLPASAVGHCLLVAEGDSPSAQSPQTIVCAAGNRMLAPATPGRYRLHPPDGNPLHLAIAPANTESVAARMAACGARLWGVMAQVYSLRTTHRDTARSTWGHGDLAAVRQLAQRLAAEGADVLALSPMHALFSSDPAACSPYCPSSRLFRNVLFAAPADVLGDEAVHAAMAALAPMDCAALEAADTIDWTRTAAARLSLLAKIHAQFRQRGDLRLRRQYEKFVEQQGEALLDHATFECLQHGDLGADEGGGQIRPALPFSDSRRRDPRSREVQDYRARHPREIDFHCFLQWLTDASLAVAQRDARSAGMRVGLMGDLAVGASPTGSQAWSHPEHFLRGVSIGAPPDIYNPLGQVWNLTAFSPLALQEQGYRPFVEVLRAGLEHMGGLRIDHILGFQRLWVVPEGGGADGGAYLHMPARELFTLTALEAWRHHALMIGENLGTVPEGFNEQLWENGIFGMNVLWFMRRPGQDQESPPFIAPARWPRDAVSMITTHDLPTVSGWWHGTDIAQRSEARLLAPDEDAESLRAIRQNDKAALWRGMGAPGAPPGEAPIPAILRFVSRTPSPLFLTSLEDLAGLSEAPNVPGTTDEFPNWRRRLPVDAVAACDSPQWRPRLEAMRQRTAPRQGRMRP
ncbi:MAG TPA: 4-alpha-glucanotransferase [Castellaniella sp.]|jgi:4-alpha-glucanotransferase|nr:4-alpha-glucanotransferase [Castellaniella sp.]